MLPTNGLVSLTKFHNARSENVDFFISTVIWNQSHFFQNSLYVCLYFFSIIAILEFFTGTKQQSMEFGTSWWQEISEDFTFFLQMYGNTRVSIKR